MSAPALVPCWTAAQLPLPPISLIPNPPPVADCRAELRSLMQVVDALTDHGLCSYTPRLAAAMCAGRDALGETA